jgi:hypothetical protein
MASRNSALTSNFNCWWLIQPPPPLISLLPTTHIRRRPQDPLQRSSLSNSVRRIGAPNPKSTGAARRGGQGESVGGIITSLWCCDGSARTIVRHHGQSLWQRQIARTLDEFLARHWLLHHQRARANQILASLPAFMRRRPPAMMTGDESPAPGTATW